MKNIKHITNDLLTAGSCALAHIPNYCMVRILSLFTLVRVSRKQTADNLAANRETLSAAAGENGFFIPGHFIENQNEWESVRFGLSTMKYSGCEIMAVYNALLDLGVRMTAQDMAELIGDFERKGAERKGRWGCSPGSIRRYLLRRGYRVTMTTRRNPDMIDLIGENSDSIIITAYNDRNDIRRMIHTVSVTKDSGGYYILHNAYKRINGRYAAYGGNSPVGRLWDIIGLISQGQAASICVIGIGKPQRLK
ncbi:MAG: hypothetical protein NC305_09350 [Lachnospiraceae bacterium]|nr:hypothetical protein [Butyrivibrio sp.]MCM1343008.1 hypothetical protein [Muribaculaceae bacterium]MCM1410738.1 hypothetical protein [Lachnospiraceae bacterium]